MQQRKPFRCICVLNCFTLTLSLKVATFEPLCGHNKRTSPLNTKYSKQMVHVIGTDFYLLYHYIVYFYITSLDTVMVIGNLIMNTCFIVSTYKNENLSFFFKHINNFYQGFKDIQAHNQFFLVIIVSHSFLLLYLHNKKTFLTSSHSNTFYITYTVHRGQS